MSWKILDFKLIFKNNFFSLRSEKCLLPNKKILNDYFLFECKDWVQVIAQDKNKNYIMVEQYRHGGKKAFLEFPGGVIDNGETPLEAANREMQEETGFQATNLKYLGFQFPNPALQTNKIHVFYAEGCEPVSKQSLDEFEDIVVMSVSEVELDEIISKSGNHSLMLSTYFTLKNYLAK